MSASLKPQKSPWAAHGELDSRVATMTDAELINLVQQNIDMAYEALWMRHVNAAWFFARRNCGLDDPEDVVVEAFARILKLLRQGQGPRDNFRSYLLITIRNLVVDDARRTDPVLLEDWDEITLVGANDYDRADQRSAVSAIFYAMKPRYREVLWLGEVEGLTVAEIAGQLDETNANVSVLLHRAKKQFRTLWQQAQSGVVTEEKV
jgi:RNA polymerase sigma factor (sigma-70 family)